MVSANTQVLQLYISTLFLAGVYGVSADTVTPSTKISVNGGFKVEPMGHVAVGRERNL